MNTAAQNSNPALAYYDGPDIVAPLQDALAAAGLDPDALDVDDLAPLDEFHAFGRAATVALAEIAGVARGERVLDVGAGIGGPARVLAARYGASVTALDATPRFCRASEALTRGAGLTGAVEVVCADALELPFPDASFDLAWTQAVGQNVADKARFMGELARVVRPGGRVALFELAAGPGGPVELPVPWADRPEQSALVPAAELRRLVERAGFDVTVWQQGKEVFDAVAAAAADLPAPAADGPLGLHLLMPDHDARMAGVARNLAGQRINLVQAVARR
jgi:SAM-dependent methyltransferase